MKEVNGYKLSIKSYMGIYEDGILVLISLKKDEDLFEGTYWYNEEIGILTLDSELEQNIDIEVRKNIQIEISSNMEDYSDIVDTLNEFKT